MTDQDVRDFLERMAAEEPVPFLDAEPLTRRARRRAARTVVVGAVGVAAAIAVLFAGVAEIRTAPAPVPADPAEPPSVDLGIFAPVAGRIVYCDETPASGPSTRTRRPPSRRWCASTSGNGRRRRSHVHVPLGWSSDGTELLFVREDPTDQTFPYDRYLYILHADGTETQVTPGAGRAAPRSRPTGRGSPSPPTGDGLYVVDAEGGQPVRIARTGKSADLLARRDADRVPRLAEEWMLRPIGARACVGGERGRHRRARDPGGRAGLGRGRVEPHVVAGGRPHRDGELPERHVAIYTFAPDGSDFTKVIPDGANPYWSPDGSQIAYMLLSRRGPYGSRIADADGSNVQSSASASVGAVASGHARGRCRRVKTCPFRHGRRPG